MAAKQQKTSSAAQKRVKKVAAPTNPIVSALESSFYQDAEVLQVSAQMLQKRIDKFITYKDFYKKRFAKTNSRSVINIKNLAEEITTSCNQMLAFQKAAKISAN